MPDLRTESAQLAPGIVSVTAEGFLDARTSSKLEDEFKRLFSEGVNRYVVCLEGVQYIASAGASVFIWANGECRSRGGGLIFLKPSPSVREIFDLTGLSQIFSYADTLEQATGQLT